MRKILNDISNYVPFGRSVIQARMSYKVGFFMRIIGGLIQVLIMYYLWLAIFNSSSSDTINGFTSSEMIIYVIMSYIAAQVINISNEWAIADDILTGSIATNLIKPIKYEKRILAESIGQVILNVSTISIPIWIIFNLFRGIVYKEAPASFTNILLFLVSAILGFIIMFLFNFIFSISAFYVTYIWGFMLCKNIIINFFSGQLIPIVFFPKAMQGILKYLPFSGMNYTPVMIYMGKLSSSEILFSIGVQVSWVVILFLLYKILWGRAIKRVTVMGG